MSFEPSTSWPARTRSWIDLNTGDNYARTLERYRADRNFGKIHRL